jgi:Na+/melibiose symporter-like transporter
VFFAMFGFFFLLTQYFQLVLGYSALEAGVKQLPFAAVMMVLAPNSPRLAARFGTNRLVAFGLVCVSCAMFMFTISRIDTSYWALLPVMMTMAGGMALVIPSMTGSIMSAVPLGKAGVGSAMNDTTRELGGALGVAVLGSLVASRYGTRLEPALAILPVDLRERASESLAGALQTARGVDGEVGAAVNRIAREAYVSGLHLAAIVAGCVVLLASGIVYRKLPAGNPHAQGAAAH